MRQSKIVSTWKSINRNYFKKLFLIILLIFYANGNLLLQASAPFDEDRDVTWFGRYSFILISPRKWKRICKKYHIKRSQYKWIKRKRKKNLYRISKYLMRYRKVKKYKYKGNIPFTYIDSNIYKRRKSNNPVVWDSGYKDLRITQKYLRYLHKKYPTYTKLVRIGKSIKKRSIYALKISDNANVREDESSFLFNGSHHGNEPLTIDYVLNLATELLSSLDPLPPAVKWYNIPGKLRELKNKYKRLKYLNYINNFELWFVPVVNPDGLHKFWYKNIGSGRKNARRTLRRYSKLKAHNGVDLNRNYPYKWKSGIKKASSSIPWMHNYRGRYAASEPETKAMIKFAKRENFVLSLSYHCYATKVLVPYTVDGARNPEPGFVWNFGKQLAVAGISNRPDKDYIAVKNLYKVDGTDQDWLFHELGTLAFIVEGSFLTPNFQKYGIKSIHGMLPLSLKSLELYEENTKLTVYTKNKNDKAIRATVNLLEFEYFEDEQFYTDKKFGRKEFLLKELGSYTIYAETEDGRSAESTINCKTKLCKITVILE